MKHRLKRIERLARNATCVGCGRPLVDPPADERGEVDRLSAAEQVELLGLMKLAIGRPCPNCGRSQPDLAGLADEQLNALLRLLRLLRKVVGSELPTGADGLTGPGF